jgi:hypothetical protein
MLLPTPVPIAEPSCSWVAEPVGAPVRDSALTLLVNVRVLKVGVAVELMFWMVFINPEEEVKLVALKVAIPLVLASAKALLTVIVPALLVALAIVKAPPTPKSAVT